ncbi:hypothetical protein RRG08_021605 [Elysia crispata]|uniref:Uncharacterized protein n=1 Tax=Elysia crispata TaxID=231223 RepID=A0AAE0XDY7_9GAST|nr:hypothetical protein RRG08_021605 [Elysia crispata]
MSNRSSSAEPKTNDHYRIAIMGPAGVGKSAIVNQFLYGKFQTDYKETVVDMHRGVFQLGDTKLTLELLDTAGAYTFPGMRRLAIATSDAFVLVYSQDKPESFEEVTKLRELILAERDTDRVSIVIVANKADCPARNRTKRQASVETESAIANIDWNHGFVSASAKTGINVVSIFEEILRLLSKEEHDVNAVLLRRLVFHSALTRKESISRSLKLKRRRLLGRSK